MNGNNEVIDKIQTQNLFQELAELINQSKNLASVQINSSITIMFWQVGKKINDFVLLNQRAEYGKLIVVTLSRQLEEKFGRNFEEKNLRRMIQFADQFKDAEIVVTLSRQLSWSHIITIIPLKNNEIRSFYIQKVIEETWSVRELRKQIGLKSYERSGISKSQFHLDNYASQIFKDPYFFDFLGLKEGYLEDDLESAIIKELEQFLLELGKGFAFVERQKRMIIDGEDYYLDLLFFHRKMKRLVAVELKIGKFKAKHKGQMELYLKWLNRYEKQEGEETPIGLILCTEASKEQIELLEMHKDGIVVSEYWTDLPPRKELETKLHQAFIQAQERMERKLIQ